MKFGDALNLSQETGIGIFRPSWNGNANRTEGVAQFVSPFSAPHQPPGGAMDNPFMYITQPNGNTPWTPSSGDLFASDWDSL